MFFLLVLILLINSFSYSKETDTASGFAKVLVYSYFENKKDDVITRKFFHQFKVYKSDSLILHCGEFFDRPAEIALPFGKYRFSFWNKIQWNDFEIEINSNNSIVKYDQLINSIKKKINQ
ncbi:MAG: hypothetical protein ACK4SO_05925 [Candidatus Kapaibacteriota bacterium]